MILTAVSLEQRWALTTDGTVVPIHSMFNDIGQRTQDPNEAVAFTAGDGLCIFAFAVSQIPKRTIN